MSALYDYFDRRLQEANLKKEKEPIEEVIRHLSVLRDAWKEMMQKQSSPGASVPDPSHTQGEWSATG
jgi:flagellar secretion chaperone FliS